MEPSKLAFKIRLSDRLGGLPPRHIDIAGWSVEMVRVDPPVSSNVAMENPFSSLPPFMLTPTPNTKNYLGVYNWGGLAFGGKGFNGCLFFLKNEASSWEII